MLSAKTLYEKKEFFWVDFFRLVFALGIVTLHMTPLKNINFAANYFVSNVLLRLGVPFFLLTSGFFLYGKMDRGDKVWQYVKRLLQLYLIYSAIYFPGTLLRYLSDREHLVSHLLRYLRYFFLIASCNHLWYFLGLAFASTLLYFLCAKIKLKDWQIGLIAACLYAVGVIGNAYLQPLIPQLSPQNHRLLWVYYKLFDTTRNGLFFSFPYLFAGYFIAKRKKAIRRRKYHYGAMAFFVLMTLEAYVVHTRFESPCQDMLFTLFPTSVFTFLSICFMEMPETDEARQRAIHFRKLSVLIYGFHPLMRSFWESFFDIWLHSQPERPLQYILVVLLTLALAECVMRLSELEKFRWLKKLY